MVKKNYFYLKIFIKKSIINSLMIEIYYFFNFSSFEFFSNIMILIKIKLIINNSKIINIINYLKKISFYSILVQI